MSSTSSVQFVKIFLPVQRVPPSQEQQAVRVLVILPGYGRDSPWTSESIKGRQLGTSCFYNNEDGSMVLCI